mgnify:CR=1 FL=1
MNLFKKSALVAICSITALTAYGHSDRDYQEHIEKSFVVGTDASLVLDNLNGKVDIQAWSNNEVKIMATILAKDEEDREKVEVILKQNNGRVSVETDYERSYFGHNHSHTKVDFEIMVPAHIDLDEIDLTNGSLTIQGVTGELNASVVNGSITSDGMSSDTKVDTVNGSIKLTFGPELTAVNNIEVNSVNGSLTLHLPQDLNASIEAETSNGSIRNEFGLNAIKRRIMGQSLYGELGNGRTQINLDSVNGSIRLKQL